MPFNTPTQLFGADQPLHIGFRHVIKPSKRLGKHSAACQQLSKTSRPPLRLQSVRSGYDRRFKMTYSNGTHQQLGSINANYAS